MGWREQQALLQGTVVRTFAGSSTSPELFTYTGVGQAPVDVPAIYRDKHAYVDTRQGVQVTTEQPTLDLAEANLLARPRQGDIIEGKVGTRHAGHRWRVQDKNSDGEGMWKLFLIQETP